MTKPIKPGDLLTPTPEPPDQVIEAFNLLIEKNFVGGRAVVTREAAEKEVRRLMRRHDASFRNADFDPRWLDVAGYYREIGWHVVVGYDGSYTFGTDHGGK